MQKRRILIVDDDQLLLRSLAEWLRQLGYEVDEATSLSGAYEAVDRAGYDVLLVDVRLGEEDGFDLLQYVRRNQPTVPVVLMTGYGTIELAVEALRAGAFDLLTKPVLDADLEWALERAFSHGRVVEENRRLRQQLDRQLGEFLVGSGPRMQRVLEIVEAVADTRATVLITGESGTGKSLLARAIHRRSSRRDGPFVEVACGALPEPLLESELFGHVAGAFTGAVGEKKGKFLLADGGTIFLDEIATASPALQVKLLRVLQELSFEPVGGNQTYRVDTRVILATNEDLARLVDEGKFRQDLYYRINVIHIELPPLRERPEDIAALAEHFIRKACQEVGKPVKNVSAEALALLENYAWPGNIRELQNVLERAVLLGKGSQIEVSDLPPRLLHAGSTSPVRPTSSLKEALEDPERQIILEVLEACDWNRTLTADRLGINRTTLYKKMRRLGLDISKLGRHSPRS
ncbi:MAG: sigma-54-dependent Fis family transcriptional regulator [Pirellulaceae bacterium]|nr:MAG: sigma-54-dependent Fis family transcriptional regulator [Pirellulaceae bacterium]